MVLVLTYMVLVLHKLIHGLSSSQAFFFETFRSLVCMDLLKCQTSNWWMILCPYSLRYFLIWRYRWVIKWATFTLFYFSSSSTLIRPAFSVQLETSSTSFNMCQRNCNNVFKTLIKTWISETFCIVTWDITMLVPT